jgi:hypothetical protein
MNFTRLTTTLASVGCWAMLTGCVGSMHPLYLEGETVFREDLVGEFKTQLGMGAPTIWKVESIDDEAYRVTMPPGWVEPEIWIMHVVELDGQLYMDFYPETVEEAAGTDATPPGHYIARLRFDEGLPISANIDDEWLDSYLADHPDELSVERMEGKMPLITSETEELQQFIITHADDGLFVNEVNELWWNRHEP